MNAWQCRAPELAGWTMANLVNRRDVWGTYLPLHRRTTRADDTTDKVRTAPAKDQRGRVLLDESRIARHYAGRDVGDLTGLHAIGAENVSRWLGVDIDAHDGATDRHARNIEKAYRIAQVLRERGCWTQTEDSDGRGGLHIWVIFDAPVSSADLFAFATSVLDRVGVEAETYPKQPGVGTRQFGNWLRLPGRHHTREHWSRMELDGEWVAGDEAVDVWLSQPLTPAAVVPPAPSTEAIESLVIHIPRPHRQGTLDARIEAYIGKLRKGLAAGSNRNGDGFTLACFLVRDLELNDGAALEWMRIWNARQADRYADSKLCELVADAHAYGERPYGAGLSDTFVPLRALRSRARRGAA